MNATLDLFKESGALLEGHFRLSSGLHSNGYLQSALVLQHPALAGRLGAALAELVRPHAPTAVLSPALGGIVIGHEVARALDVRAIFAERQDGKLSLRRGFTLGPDDRLVVIEDVVTTGGSTRETIDVATSHGATVSAAGSIIDRSGGQSSLGVPYHALVSLALPTWQEAECPLCAQGIPAIKPGSRFK
ncbi:MAG: orotate phosphoribosyltransferase [Acidobacteriota bacterium]|nr:orotate phosphoribosyltransferase [Acidobacteriota bacterium]